MLEASIYADETYKSIKDMIQRRHLFLKGRGKLFVMIFFHGDNRDMRCVFVNS